MYNYSIIIPHKNIPDLLIRCLNSIPLRDDIQIIIIDDNSDFSEITKSTFPGINRKNTKIIFLDEDKGPGYARNLGLKSAEGRWLIFADADDFFNVSFLNIFDKYKETDNDIVYFLADSINSNSLEPASRHLHLVNTRNKYIRKLQDNKLEAKNELIYKNWEAWAKMFRKTFIDTNSLFFEEENFGEDALFVIKAGELSRTFSVDNFPVYCITYRDNSLCFKEENENEYDQKFNAKIRINNYLLSRHKDKFLINIDEDIIKAYKYGGLKKVRNSLIKAKQNGNKIKMKTYLRVAMLYASSIFNVCYNQFQKVVFSF